MSNADVLDNSPFVKNIIKNKLVELSRVRGSSINDVRKELMSFLDVTSQQYTRWENNTSQPDLENALKISEFFSDDAKRIFFITKLPG